MLTLGSQLCEHVHYTYSTVLQLFLPVTTVISKFVIVISTKMIRRIVILSCLNAALGDDSYPSCGDCWCAPESGGLGPCPIWEPQTNFSESVINTYASQIPITYYQLNCNPYEDDTCTTTPTQQLLEQDAAVCAFMYPKLEDGSLSCSQYEMITFPSREEAERAGGTVTHAGSCGLCSTAKDLAIYLSKCSIRLTPIYRTH